MEAFNEELDGMYNDANLPEDEAWTAMSRDLQRTKETRNALSKENSYVYRIPLKFVLRDPTVSSNDESLRWRRRIRSTCQLTVVS